jgi:hypothetical protein
MALLRWPLYLLGALIAIPACFSVWVLEKSDFIGDIRIPGISINLDHWVIADYGGLVIVLLILAILLLDLLTSRSDKSPKALIVAGAATLTVAAWYVVRTVRHSESYGIYGGTWVFPVINRIVYGSLLVLAAALWGYCFARQPQYSVIALNKTSGPGTYRKVVEWDFYFQWLLASAAGMTLGVCLGALTRDALNVPLYVWWMRLQTKVWPNPFSREVIELARQSTPLIPYGLVLGVSIGVMQWFVLRKHLGRSWGWILASALGWAVSWSTSFGIDYWRFGATGLSHPRYLYYRSDLAGLFLVVGVMIGVVQYFLFRRQVRRLGWWILASAVGGAAAGRIWAIVPYYYSTRMGAPHEPGTAFLSGLANGAITGLVLLILLRQFQHAQNWKPMRS